MEIKELENRFDVFCVDNNLDNSFLKKDRGIGWLSESNDNEISYRKLKNKLLLSNMREITQVLTRANVQFVFLKGLIEAYDLYPEFYFRPCDDIDILVHKDQIVDACLELANLGFTYERGAEITKERLIEDSINATSHHFTPFVKKTKYGINVGVEMHYCLDETWNNNPNDFTRDIIAKRGNVKIGEFEFPVLSKENRFAFALFHCGRDIFYVYENIGFSNKSKYKLKSLIDAILLNEKYSLNTYIDNECINEYGFAPCVSFANEFCYKVFGIRLIQNITVTKFSDAFKEVLYYRLQSIEPHAILLSDKTFVKDVFVSITDSLLNKNPCFLCTNEFKRIPDNEFSKIIRRESTFVAIEKENCSINIKIKYDENLLYFVFDVHDLVVKVRGIGKKNKWGESINILFYNPDFELGKEKCLKGVFLEPYYNALGTIDILSSYIGRWEDLLNGSEFRVDESFTNFRFKEDGYVVETAIRWDDLGINLGKTKYIGLEFVINNVDSDDCEIEFSYIWSKREWQRYKPYNYHRVILDLTFGNQTL